jgi:hypothetical protein
VTWVTGGKNPEEAREHYAKKEGGTIRTASEKNGCTKPAS